jgi:hypothetical protein
MLQVPYLYCMLNPPHNPPSPPHPPPLPPPLPHQVKGADLGKKHRREMLNVLFATGIHMLQVPQLQSMYALCTPIPQPPAPPPPRT